MCDILALGMLIFGIITLVTGKFSLTRTKKVYGAPARVVGVIMLLPLPLLLIAGVMLGFGLVAAGRPLDKEEAQRVGMIGMIVGAGIVVACFIAAIVVAAINSEPERMQAQRPRRDEDYDDRGRHEDRERHQQRGYDDDRDEPGSPRPRRCDEDDEDRPPRRREPPDDYDRR